VAADVWSVTSYQELYRDGHAADRWNRLHPGEKPRVPWVTSCLSGTEGVIVSASDYVKAMADGIDRWVPRRLTSLGTDGFGRSEGRASLRDFFEVDAKFIVQATLSELAREGTVEASVVKKAIKDLGINPEKRNPAVS
jgi:pyruvate dehydrogenase E1 component